MLRDLMTLVLVVVGGGSASAAGLTCGCAANFQMSEGLRSVVFTFSDTLSLSQRESSCWTQISQVMRHENAQVISHPYYLCRPSHVLNEALLDGLYERESIRGRSVTWGTMYPGPANPPTGPSTPPTE